MVLELKEYWEKMRKLFDILNSVKVSKDEDMNVVCPVRFARWTSLVIIQSSFGGMLEIEAKMESHKHIVDEALETINVECSFRSLQTDGI